MKKNISCIIQARTNSVRLPGKTLLSLGNKTVFQYQIERLKKSKKIDSLILATTKNKNDDKLCAIAKNKHINIFRGDEKNVLERYYLGAKKNKSSVIVRVTADCPLIDVKYIDKLIQVFIKNKYDYMTNLYFNYLPDGFHCEIFNFETLSKTYKLAKKDFDKEHVTSYIWKNPKIFKIKYFKGKKFKNFSKKIRLTLDYYEDYVLIKSIFDNLYKKNKYFSLLEILAFLKKNSKFLKINEKYHRLQWNKFHSKRTKYLSIS